MNNTDKRTNIITTVLIWGQLGFFAFLAIWKITVSISYDYFFMVPTGHYIFNHQIMNSHVFAIDEVKLVIQQWLYCLYLYIISPLGKFGIIASIFLIFLLINFSGYLIIQRRGLGKKAAGMVLFCCFVLSQGGYLLEIRPEAITVLLCFLEIILIEEYQKSHKILYLYLMPILMILEINLHGSMWVIHYIVLTPYIVGLFVKNIVKKQFRPKEEKWIHQLNALGLMSASMFINPYGLDMILYTPRTFWAQTFSYLTIYEIEKPAVFSLIGFCILLIVSGTAFLIAKKSISSVSVCAIVIYTLLVVLYKRNISFLYLAFFYFLIELFQYMKQQKVQVSFWFQVRKTAAVITVISAVVMAVIAVNKVFIDNDFVYKQVPIQIVGYLDKNANKETHIYTGFNSGNYLEYYGYENIYIDSRPEIYMKQVNGSKDILPEYSKYGLYGYYESDISDDEFREYLDEYSFEYYIVDVERKMQDYLERSEDYELILIDKGYSLYRKVN